MYRFNFKIGLFFLLLSFASTLLFAQPAFRAKERITEFKKMKLLEILDLDEQTSNKFLSKYNSAEKLIGEKREKLQDAILDLEYLLRKKAKKEDIQKQSQIVMDAQSDLMNTMFEQQKEFKSVLNDEQFAKYLIFENRFREEIQKFLIKRAKGEEEK
ncbi:MAG: hypothetical protein ACUVQ1_09000, partial [Candidatus Kapaibacteriales bacterium]